MKTERLEDLIQQYVSNTLDGAEREELAAYLKLDDSRDARRLLRRSLEADSHLEEAAASGEMAPPEAKRSFARFAPALWLGIGGLAALVIIGFSRFSDEPKTGERLAVASVIRSDGTRLEAYAPGKPLREGDVVKVEEGVIEAAFFETGVHFIASAPLTMTVQSSERIFLHRGEIKLHVPPQGIGFVVETTDRSITDLGTSFVVSAMETESKVLVLEGEVSIADHESGSEQLMKEGEFATFDLAGAMELRTKQHTNLPEISPKIPAPVGGLSGRMFAFADDGAEDNNPSKGDLIGPEFLSLVRSGFEDTSFLNQMIEGVGVPFQGIAGAYSEFPERVQLGDYDISRGWMAWYQGRVRAPAPGRYRFWGYADNHLLAAIDGVPIFDGCRYDSVLRKELQLPRRDFPSFPCLNAPAGFAAGSWFEVGDDPVRIDILFGELNRNATSGILLIEREGEAVEEIYWGQPKWPLFQVGKPSELQTAELRALRLHMEQKLMGTFSLNKDAVWQMEK